MRAGLGSVALLNILASLLLVQVLAAPQNTSNSPYSTDIVVRDHSEWRLRAPRTEEFPALMVRLFSRTTRPQANFDARAADHTADAAAIIRREKALIESDHIDDRHQALAMHLEREAVSAISAVEEQDKDAVTSSLVLRSAAPKVLGINIYLIIAWLALMYLMYRTGSF